MKLVVQPTITKKSLSSSLLILKFFSDIHNTIMPHISFPAYNSAYSFAEKKKKKKGKVGVIQRSDRPGKKFKVLTPEGKTVHFGHSDYNINVGKDKGKKGSRSDSYCARSAGIKDKGKYSPNSLSRRMWGCVGDQGVPSKKLRIGDKV